MEQINIMLTDKQREAMKPLFDATLKACADGNPIAILAQVWDGNGGDAFITARCIDTEMIHAIQRAGGVLEGTMPREGATAIVIDTECEEEGVKT